MWTMVEEQEPIDHMDDDGGTGDALKWGFLFSYQQILSPACMDM